MNAACRARDEPTTSRRTSRRLVAPHVRRARVGVAPNRYCRPHGAGVVRVRRGGAGGRHLLGGGAELPRRARRSAAPSPTRSGCGARCRTSAARRRATPTSRWSRRRAAATGSRRRLDVALFRDDAAPVRRALDEVPGAELGNDVEVRIRGRVTVYPPTGPLPAGDDRHRSRVHRRRHRRQPRAGAARAGRRGSARRATRSARAAAGAAARRPGHERGQRRLPRLRARARAHRRTRGRSAWSTCGCRAPRAARRIKWALGELARLDLDVVVMVRGGGSRADLAPFDTELVARAIAAMAVPVVTGVGHEIDRSVADEVAHTACKTPTACAQLLVRQVDEFVGAPRRRVAAGRRAGPAADGRRGPRARRRRPPGPAQRDGRGRAGAAPGSTAAHGRLDELARRRTVDLGARLDTARAGSPSSVGGDRVTAESSWSRAERAVVTHSQHHLERATLRARRRSEAVVRSARSAPRARAWLLDHPRRRRPGGADRRCGRGRRTSSRPSSRAVASPAASSRPSTKLPRGFHAGEHR